MMTSLNWITVIKILPNKWPSGKMKELRFVHKHTRNKKTSQRFLDVCVKMMPDSMIWILHLCAQIKYCKMFADDIYLPKRHARYSVLLLLFFFARLLDKHIYNTIYSRTPQILMTRLNEWTNEMWLIDIKLWLIRISIKHSRDLINSMTIFLAIQPFFFNSFWSF